MAYTLSRGVQSLNGRSQDAQRRLLVGIPILVLAIILLAIFARHSQKSNRGAQVIPVVSAITTQNTSGKGGNNKSSPGGNSGSNPTAASSQSAGGTQSLGFGSATPISSGSNVSGTGGTTGVIGGMGGGPTGGGGTSGGGTTLPNCSIDQIATVTCLVTQCSPAVTLAPGQKAILGVDGTCVVVN